MPFPARALVESVSRPALLRTILLVLEYRFWSSSPPESGLKILLDLEDLLESYWSPFGTREWSWLRLEKVAPPFCQGARKLDGELEEPIRLAGDFCTDAELGADCVGLRCA